MNKSTSFAVGTSFLIFIASCVNEVEVPDTDRNHPNPSSELALLMRSMKSKTIAWKNALESGTPMDTNRIYEEFSTIHNAIPTDPDVRGPSFDGFSANYLDKLKFALRADSGKAKTFNAMVDACMDCHSEFCPGPMKVIKKMYLNPVILKE